MTRVTRLIHDVGKCLLISVYPLPTHPTHNFTHKNGGNLDTLSKKLHLDRPAQVNTDGRTGGFHNRKPPVPPVTKTPPNRQRLRVDDMLELYSLVINVVIVTTQQSPVAPRAASKPAPGATSDYKAVTPTDWCSIHKSDISYNKAVQI